MLYAALFYAAFPLIVLWWIGLNRTAAFLLIVYGFFLLQAVGFASGLLANVMFHDSDWWKQFVLPHMYMDSWVQNAGADQFWKMMLVPYFFVFDMILVYIKFNFTMGNLALWIPEIMCFKFFLNYLVRFDILPRRALSPAELLQSQKSEAERFRIRRERMSKEPGYWGQD